MSNAMRSGKRALAGVAAGALALGMLSIAGASTATAAKVMKPKAGTTAATVYAVRPTGLGGTSPITLPAATLAFSGGGTIGTTSTVDLLTAPTASARFYYGADDTVTLNTDDTVAASALTNGNSTDDTTFNFFVDTAGNYSGRIYNGVDTVTFAFTTAGAPASMTLTPASQTVLVGGQADLTVTLLDASGRETQPQTVDTVQLTRSPTDDTIVALDAAPGAAAITQLSAANLSKGSGSFSLETNTVAAGTTTVTATPAGTLGSGGVTAQTATVTKSGTVASNSVRKFTVTTPSNAYNNNTNVAASIAQVQVPTVNLSVTIDDTTAASAGNVVRMAVRGPSGGVINGSTDDTVFVDLTTDANKQAKLDLTLGGTALNVGAEITVQQVTVQDIATSVPTGALLTITQTQAAVQGANIVPTPLVALAKVGASTPVTVQVDDSFGAPQAGWTVRAYRTSTGGALLSTAVTNASGQAAVTVSPLSTTVSGQSETYVFTATAPVGGSAILATKETTVAYTTSGEVTSMSIVPNTGTTFTTASSTLTTAPVVFVPDDTAGIVYGLSAGNVTLSTGVDSAAPTGMYTTFIATTSPAAATTVSVSADSGLQLSTTAPGATTAWNSGATSVVVVGSGGAAGTVYVWGTKTGTHDITFTAGTTTLTGKIKVSNRAQDAYNISVTPAKDTVAKGGFKTVVAKVTDYWGNPVATTTGALTATAGGQVLLGGYVASNTFTTNTAGEATITVIGANDTGTGTVTITPTTTGAPPAWTATYTKPSTLTSAPVTSAVSEITVTGGTTDKTIVIDGMRTTVKGKPGVMFDGATTGFDEGSKMVPHIKFPGQTSYSEGSARPTTDALGDFTWQRKTGKKIYVYFTNEDGDVKSNRVIIQAK